MRLMGPSRIPSPRPFHGSESCSGSVGCGGVHPSGDWSTPILVPRTRLLTPLRFRPVHTRAKLISSATTIIRRPSHVAVFFYFLFFFFGGGERRRIEAHLLDRRGHWWPGCVTRPPAFRRTPYPLTRGYHPYVAPRAHRPSRRRRRYYIRATAAGRKLIAKILRI